MTTERADQKAMVQKERILAGAEELFFKAGIRSVTMDDIAKHLGISKKTIYVFFKDKDEVVTALVHQKLQEDKDRMCGIVESSGNVMEELIFMIKCAEDFFSRINPILIHDMQKYHPESWQLVQKFKAENVVDNLTGILTRGISQGYIREAVNPRIMAKMHMLQTEAGFNTNLFPPSEYNTWTVQMQFLEHFLYGICTGEGRAILDDYRNIYATTINKP